MKSLLVVLLIVFCSSSLVSSREPLIIPATAVEGGEDTCPTEQQKQDILGEIGDQVRAALRKDSDIECLTDLGSLQSNPASSCNKIYQCSPLSPSGSYWLRGSDGSAVEVYCDMNHTACCNSTGGGWTRIAQFDMTDPTQNCPEGWRYIDSPKRLCGRDDTGSSCESVIYPTYGVNYQRVCGRVVGYQHRSPDGLQPHSLNRPTIDGVYVDGVSVTHGSNPRQHVWTFVNTLDYNSCPCSGQDVTGDGYIPDYVGEDYFCELGVIEEWQSSDFYEDPLWDGEDCHPNSQCCEFNNPPWFCQQLEQPTSDDIEVRVCGDQSYIDEDTPLEVIELYVQL